MSNVHIGDGTPAGLIEMNQSNALAGSRLQFGLLNQAGFAHHMISHRDICFDSANGLFFFRRTAAAGNPNNFTDLVRIAANGDMTVTGTLNAAAKNFCIPHPLDPDNAQLVHGSIEGAEYAVFYRGEGSLENGTARVQLPSYFEALTRGERRTVQLTPVADGDEPISPLAASAVQNGAFTVRGLDRANPKQRFYWEVKAVRSDIAPLVVEIPHASTVETAEPVMAGASS
jgi:hypothetical protein